LRTAAWIFFALAVAVPAAAQELVPGRVLVRYKGGSGHRVVRVPDTMKALAALRADPSVEWAEPDYIRRRYSVTPDDEMYQYQWALPMIRAPQAWARTTGLSTVVVAVVDTGILPHPDLKDRLVDGYDFISDPASANDGDGRDPDPTDTGSASEESSGLHGLHVAGVLGATANNKIGVAGLDWQCRIQPIRVLGVRGGSGVDSDIADAIRWAAGLHVDGVPDNATPAAIINMSFGGQGMSKAMQSAVDDAIAAGAVVVAAAGNTGLDASMDVPAGLHGVITVGAVDQTGQRASYSNYGPAVSLMAPGGMLINDQNGNSEGILSTIQLPTTGFTYVYYAGTSQAAPFVSGTLSLLLATDPSFGPKDLRKLVIASADPGSQCPDPDDPTKAGCGAGLLDVDAALQLAAGQHDCAPACGDDQVCMAGACVTVASLTNTNVGPPQVTTGGCSTSGRAPGVPAGTLLLLSASLILLLRRKV
jgi:serine protease